MIKINLLPRSINEKRIIRNTALIFAFLLVVVIAGGMTYYTKLRGDVQAMEQQATDTEAWEARVQGIQKQGQDMLASVQPIQQKIDFIAGVLEYNQKFAALYEQVGRWTYERIVYTSMQSDGNVIAMQARAKSLDDVGRFLLNMYRATDLFTEVVISGVPGYPSAQSGVSAAPSGPDYAAGGQISGSQASLAGIGAITSSMDNKPVGGNWVDFTVICKLRTPIVAPAFAGAAAAPAQGMGGQPGYTPGAVPMSPPPGT